MSDIAPIRQRIVIKKISGNGGKDLHDCYFLPTAVDGVYNLYDERSKILAADIVSGQNFNFTVDKVHFDIRDFKIDNAMAEGKWKNNAPSPGEEQDGSFQAQVGGGVETAGIAEASVVSDAPAGAIVIDTVTGGSDKDKLKKCYFLADGTQYDFYKKDGTELASGLTSGTNFNFTKDSINWTVTNFVISSTAASGTWSNPDSITAEQDGTFQAQVGGGAGEDESASAATA
jgi:hypothetical protein